VVITEYSAKT